MLDQDFCEFLEYRITKALKETANEDVRGFWCDGVLLPTNERGHLALQHVKHHRKIVFKAFIGKDGQSEYELVVKIGNDALNRYTHNEDLKVCVPDIEDLSWFEIDTEKRRVWIQLK
jgi:hypothetical protein